MCAVRTRQALLTFAQQSTMIHTLVVVLVLGAEGGVVVVPHGVMWDVATEVGQEEAVAVELVAQREVIVLSIADVAVPVLPIRSKRGWRGTSA